MMFGTKTMPRTALFAALALTTPANSIYVDQLHIYPKFMHQDGLYCSRVPHLFWFGLAHFNICGSEEPTHAVGQPIPVSQHGGERRYLRGATAVSSPETGAARHLVTYGEEDEAPEIDDKAPTDFQSSTEKKDAESPENETPSDKIPCYVLSNEGDSKIPCNDGDYTMILNKEENNNYLSTNIRVISYKEGYDKMILDKELGDAKNFMSLSF